MPYVNAVLNTLCDLLLLPFRGENGWPGMLTVSCISAALFVLVFRIFSDQRALKYSKGRMLARALDHFSVHSAVTVSSMSNWSRRIQPATEFSARNRVHSPCRLIIDIFWPFRNWPSTCDPAPVEGIERARTFGVLTTAIFPMSVISFP